MADDTARTSLETVAELLARHGVEFIVIGGQAEVLHGSPRVTYDVDVCYRRSAENLEKLAAALRELSPTLRGAPKDLPFRLDAAALALGSNFTFSTSAGDLDLLGHVEPLGGFDQLMAGADRIALGGLTVSVIGLNDLIQIKRFIGRPKDRQALAHLEAIQRARHEAPRDP